MAEEQKNKISQFLSFKLDDEVFAVDVARVREVLEILDITKIPRMPDYMCGVINLRGSVVPVIDLRIKFNLHAAEYTVDTCIIVLEVNVGEDNLTIGAIADSVQEVFDMAFSEIEPPPQIGARMDTDFLVGMGKWKEQFLMILNIDNVFSTEELISMADKEKETLATETAEA